VSETGDEGTMTAGHGDANGGAAGDDGDGGDTFVLPRIPASSGALIFDDAGRLLIVNPTYKAHWTIPGGIMEADGETPWEACRREVREEVGLEVSTGRLVVVDFLRPRPSKPGGMRFLFDCGVLPGGLLDSIQLQEEELSEYRLAKPARALELLSKPLRRRVGAVLDVVGPSGAAGVARLRDAGPCVYLEDGRPV
jgi:8-oxo-dGTP diphosphatase